MTNDELYDQAMEAITKLFSDTSVSPSKARENLRTLQGEIDDMIDTLPED